MESKRYFVPKVENGDVDRINVNDCIVSDSIVCVGIRATHMGSWTEVWYGGTVE